MVVKEGTSVVPAILSNEQLASSKDDEIYIVRIPNTLSTSSILSLDMNLKSPNRILVEKKEFSPIVTKDVPDKSIFGPSLSSNSPSVLKVKGIVMLRESVKVPPIPKVEIPKPYKVPHPKDLVERHPIYGRQDALESRNLKRPVDEDLYIKTEDEPVPKKKKKKEKKKDLEKDVKLESDDVSSEPVTVAKKKKKKDKKSRE